MLVSSVHNKHGGEMGIVIVVFNPFVEQNNFKPVKCLIDVSFISLDLHIRKDESDIYGTVLSTVLQSELMHFDKLLYAPRES